MSQRIFITTLSSPEAMNALNLSFAACNFSRNLMSGGMFDKIYSILPPFVRGTLNQNIIPMDAEMMYSKFRKKSNIIYKILSLWDENIQIYRKIPNNASVWYYNLCMLNVILFLGIKLFKPTVKQNVIVLDFSPNSKHFSLLNLYKWLFNNANSTILLTRYFEFTNKNSACLPGVVPQNVEDYPEVVQVSNEFLISGALSENISLLRTLLIPAFKQMPNFILHITGDVCDKKNLSEDIKQYKNIIYHGKLTFEQYLDLLHSVTFVFSTRNPEAVENQCNFPSKIIESLLHNRAVISTIDYPQLDDLKYFKVSFHINEFICSINKIFSEGENYIMQYVNQAKQTRKKFSPQVWKDTMIKLESNGK